MNITKFGHCCLLIEIKGLRILTDPGDYTEQQNTVKDIDVVLITHEHADHLHMDSVKVLIKNNPKARIMTNSAVGKLLHEQGIAFETVEQGQQTEVEGVKIEGFGNEHAEIYHDYKRVQNTGFFIDNHLFYPGDALYNPKRPVPVLALPVAGPWIKAVEAIDYCRQVKPQKCFPVHDGVLKRTTPTHPLVKMFVEPDGIQFIGLEIDQPTEL